jgi:hypothetical protein
VEVQVGTTRKPNIDNNPPNAQKQRDVLLYYRPFLQIRK